IACMEDCLTVEEPTWAARLQAFRKVVYDTENTRDRRSADHSLPAGHHMEKRYADMTNSSCSDLSVSLCWVECKNNSMQAVARQKMSVQLKYYSPSESQDDVD
ncbi:hypothetical protein AAVH_22248, partial [Aphelenchoides avenae]